MPSTTPTKFFTPEQAQTLAPIPVTFTPTPGIGSTMIGKDGMVLVYVPEGKFIMGSDLSPDQQPVHVVNLDAFWIDQTEVTNEMYAECVNNADCISPRLSRSLNRSDCFGNSEFNNYPVIFVDWDQANAYCQSVGRRLPTEAEWEKASRSADERTYPWGEGIDCLKANYQPSCFGDTAPVKIFSNGISPYGANDMADNVWEWVSSLYKPYPYNSNDGRENLSALGARVLRSGSWYLVAGDDRSANRRIIDYSDNGDIGFRCARSQP